MCSHEMSPLKSPPTCCRSCGKEVANIHFVSADH